MDILYAFWSWLLSWGVVGLCVVAVATLCWRCGFPLKHRTPPSVDAIATALFGTLLAVSGANLLYNTARTMNPTDPQRPSIIVAGFVMFFVGLGGLLRAFNRAVSESPPPSNQKKSVEEVSSTVALEPHRGEQEQRAESEQKD